jgi:hypothetical protein
VFDLGSIITSKTRMAVIELFIKDEHLEIGVRETARRIEANPMLARKELILLEHSGLLKSRKVANSIQYSLNLECKAIGPFRQLLGVENDR